MAAQSLQDPGVGAEFDVQRKRAAQNENAVLQRQKEALARRAASLGGAPGGVFIKQEQLAGDESAQRLQNANEGIDIAQNAENRRIREIQQGREYQTAERLGSQEFGRGERLSTQEFGRGERLSTQEFGRGERLSTQEFYSGQADTARKYGTSERLGSQEFAATERAGSQAFAASQNQLQAMNQLKLQAAQIASAERQGDLSREQAAAALEQAKIQFNQTLKEEKRVNTHNMNQKDPLESFLSRAGKFKTGGAIGGGKLAMSTAVPNAKALVSRYTKGF